MTLIKRGLPFGHNAALEDTLLPASSTVLSPTSPRESFNSGQTVYSRIMQQGGGHKRSVWDDAEPDTQTVDVKQMPDSHVAPSRTIQAMRMTDQSLNQQERHALTFQRAESVVHVALVEQENISVTSPMHTGSTILAETGNSVHASHPYVGLTSADQSGEMMDQIDRTAPLSPPDVGLAFTNGNRSRSR